MKNKRNWKKIISFVLASIMVLSVTGCGGDKDSPEQVSQVSNEATLGVNGYVYVAEYQDILDTQENSYIGNSFFKGNKLYFNVYNWNEETGESSEDLYYKECDSDKAAEKLPITFNGNINLQQFLVGEDDSIVCVLSDSSTGTTSPDGYVEPENFLVKYDLQGNEKFRQNITSTIKGEEEYAYVSGLVTDTENRIYLYGDRNIWLFDAEGNYSGSIQSSEWINNMGTGKDGKVYTASYMENGYGIQTVDFNAKTLGETYKNYPSGNGRNMIPGITKDFLVSDGSKVYEYDKGTQTAEEILNWLDSDINGQYVDYLYAMEDGRIVAIINDWESNDTQLALLTKTEASKVEEKTIVTLGTFYSGSDLQSAAVKFNRSNPKYRIKIQNYMDMNSSSETAYQDAVTSFNNAVTSGNGPDLICLGYINNIENLAEKGLLEDLTPYLDASTTLKKEDFIESVLNAYTINEALICIPTSFSLLTVLGKTSMVGEKIGWTLGEMLAFADANPNAQIFEYATRHTILEYCMMNNRDAFIDFKTGECSFDSDDFKKVLEFANRFPEEYDYNSMGEKSTMAKLAENEVLLNQASVYSVDNFVMEMQMFGEEPVTCIGFPTVDGTPGCVLNPSEDSFAISAKSQNKEGAWEFIEQLLASSEDNSRGGFGLPSRKDALEKIFEEEMKIEYVKDENGEVMLDENGEPMKQQKSGWGFEDGTEISYYGATQEQIDVIKEQISVAKLASNSDSQILDIILEEAAPYFNGQKSVDEVIGIIQSRVKIYISENS